MEFDQHTLVFLVRPPDAPELSPEEADALQDAHLAFRADLREKGHLLAGGPLVDQDDESVRGVSVMSVDPATARELCGADPAVRAGRLAVRVMTWMMPAGNLRFEKVTAPRSTAEVTGSDPKAELRVYLARARDALLWKMDGLSEYDIRRPLVPTGTNLLGLVKHVASVASGYFGECFGRPFGEPMPWLDDGAETNADMWAAADETREQIVGLYRRAWAHADATIDATPLDAIGEVAWWPPERRRPTLHRVLIHMIAETERHAGHADIIRELIDGSAGVRADQSSLPDVDAAWWRAYRDRLEVAARDAAAR